MTGMSNQAFLEMMARLQQPMGAAPTTYNPAMQMQATQPTPAAQQQAPAQSTMGKIGQAIIPNTMAAISGKGGASGG